jgi:hypothetical protein
MRDCGARTPHHRLSLILDYVWLNPRCGACSDVDFLCQLVLHQDSSGLRQWIQVGVHSQSDCEDFVLPTFSQVGQYICEADALNFDDPDTASPWFLGL